MLLHESHDGKIAKCLQGEIVNIWLMEKADGYVWSPEENYPNITMKNILAGPTPDSANILFQFKAMEEQTIKMIYRREWLGEATIKRALTFYIRIV